MRFCIETSLPLYKNSYKRKKNIERDFDKMISSSVCNLEF